MAQGANSILFSRPGRDFSIIGAVAPRSTSPASWVCVQDGQQTKRLQLDAGFVGYYTLCDGQGLAEGNHTVRVTFSGGANSLWVDSFQYVIASTADIGDEWEAVGALDTRIKYPSGSWYEIRGTKWTNSFRGSLIYNFVGT